MSDSTSLNFRLGDDAVAVEVDDLVIAGWTGRDAAAIEAHIEELAAIGIPRPSTVPLFYRVAADTLAVHDGVRSAERFDFELEDPVLGRTLRHGYDVAPLPIVT